MKAPIVPVRRKGTGMKTEGCIDVHNSGTRSSAQFMAAEDGEDGAAVPETPRSKAGTAGQRGRASKSSRNPATAGAAPSVVEAQSSGE